MPRSKLGAGDLTEFLHLQSRDAQSDGFNDQASSGPFKTRFSVWANLQPRFGSEAFQAARLEGRQPFTITVRNSSQVREVNEAWQIADARDERRVFAIVGPPADPDGYRDWIEFLAVLGAPS